MGQSTDAILFWGIAYKEGQKVSDDVERDYANAKGLPAVEWDENRREEYREYRKQVLDLAKASGCLLGTHCSGNYPMHYAAVNASETTTHRGDVQEITSLQVGADWSQKLEDFCKTLDLPWQQPKWWLVSYWG